MALYNLRDLQIHNANEGSFGVDLAGSFVARSIRAVGEVKADINQQALDDPSIRQRVGESNAKLLGLKNATKLTFSTFLRGTGTAAGASTAAKGAADLDEGQLLKNAFGGESLGTGTTVNDPSATVTSFIVTSAAGLSIGQAIGVVVGGTIEVSVIANIVTNTVTLVRALSAAPSNGAVVYASATYYPAEDLTTTLQAQALTAGAADHYWRLLGVQLDPKFANLAPGQIPQVNYDGVCVGWAKKTGGSLTVPTLLNSANPPIPGYASTLMLGTVGQTTRTVWNVSGIQIDPGLGVTGVGSVSGVEGLQRYVRSAIKPTIQLTVNEWDDVYPDAFSAQTQQFLHYQIGTTAGQIVFVEIQNLTWDDPGEPANVNNQLGTTLKGTGREYGSTISDIRRAAIRLHLL